jgi:hypothetical protein
MIGTTSLLIDFDSRISFSATASSPTKSSSRIRPRPKCFALWGATRNPHKAPGFLGFGAAAPGWSLHSGVTALLTESSVTERGRYVMA